MSVSKEELVYYSPLSMGMVDFGDLLELFAIVSGLHDYF